MRRGDVGGNEHNDAITEDFSKRYVAVKRRKKSADYTPQNRVYKQIAGPISPPASMANSMDPFRVHQEAVRLYENNEFKQALDHFNRISEVYFNEHDIYRVAVCNFYSNKLVHAKALFDRLLVKSKSDNENIYAFDALSCCFFIAVAQHEKTECVAIYDRISKLFEAPESGISQVRNSVDRRAMMTVIVEGVQGKIDAMVSAYGCYEGNGLGAGDLVDRNLYCMMVSVVGSGYIEKKEYLKAIQCFLFIRSNDFWSDLFQRRLVCCYYFLYQTADQNTPKVRAALVDEAKKVEMDSDEINSCLAALAIEDGRLDEAKLYCKRAAMANPSSVQAFGMLVRCCIEAGDFNQATEVLQRIPQATSQAQLGARKEQFTQVIALIREKYQDTAKRDEHFFYILSVCYLNLNGDSTVKDKFDFVLNRFGDEGLYAFDALVNYCFLLIGERSMAVLNVSYRRLCDIFANEALGHKAKPLSRRRFHMISVIVFSMRNDLESAITSHGDFLNEAVTDRTYLDLLLCQIMSRSLALCYFAHRNYARAIFFLDAIRQDFFMATDQANLIITLFNHYMMPSGNDHVGVKQRLIVEARKVKSSDERINLSLALFAFQEGRWNEVKLYSDRVTEINPTSQQNLSMLVRYYIEHRDLTNALETLQHFSQADRAKPSTLVYFGVIHYLQGEMSAAKECLNKSLQGNGNEPLALTYRAAIHFDEGEYQEAHTMSEKAIAESVAQPDELAFKVKADASYQLLVGQRETRTPPCESHAKVSRAEDVVEALAACSKKSRAAMPTGKWPYLPRGGRATVMPSLQMLATDACKKAVAEGRMRGDKVTIFKRVQDKAEQVRRDGAIVEFCLGGQAPG
jgi:tetratricopeptide (TPR) repeat protein